MEEKINWVMEEAIVNQLWDRLSLIVEVCFKVHRAMARRTVWSGITAL
jgi:hypothetical protein